MMAVSTEWIFFYHPIDFYLSRILLLCNLIPLNVGPHLQFDCWRSVGMVEVCRRLSSIETMLLRLKKATNRDVRYNYVTGPVSL